MSNVKNLQDDGKEVEEIHKSSIQINNDTQKQKHMCSCDVVIFIFIFIVFILGVYFWFLSKGTVYPFCEKGQTKGDLDDILPECPNYNKTIYIDLQDNETIISAVHNEDFTNYPITYNWNVIEKDLGCPVEVYDEYEQAIRIINFENCEPHKMQIILNISVTEYQSTNSKQCDVNLVFYESPIFGIDLGTAYSCISFQRKQKNKNNQRNTIIGNKQECIPSAVYFHKNKTTIIGENALHYLPLDPRNVIYDIKMLIGRNETDQLFQTFRKTHYFNITNDNKRLFIPNWNKTVSFQQIIAVILGYLVETASKEWTNDGTKFDNKCHSYYRDVIVSVPAIFHTGQREAIRSGCMLAGLNLIRLQTEPSLAAVAFAHKIGHDEEVKKQLQSFLAFDFGGGALDCSIIRCTGKQCEVLAVDGNDTLGGSSFDYVIQDIIVQKLKSKHHWNTDMIKKHALEIVSKCEHIKIALSVQYEAKVSINNTTIHIERAEFEDHVTTKQLIQSAIDVVNRTVTKTSVSIRAVLMIGGTSKIPIIKDKLEQNFVFLFKTVPIIFNSHIDSQLMVVTGAGIVAGSLKYAVDNSLTSWNVSIEVTPLPYGFAICEVTETGICPIDLEQCSVMKKVSQRNTQFGTTLDPVELCQVNANETKMKLDLYEGDDKNVHKNYFLAEMIIHGIEPRDPHRPCGNVLLSLEINENGTLIYTATDNPIWNIIIYQFQIERDWNMEMIVNSDLYSKPKLYTQIIKYLAKPNITEYELVLTINEGQTDEIIESIYITQQDIDIYPVKQYEITMDTQNACNSTSSLNIPKSRKDMKSWFDPNTFNLLPKAFDDDINPPKPKSQIKQTNKKITLLEFEKLAAILHETEDITTEIVLAAGLCSLSYKSPYDRARIISDIIYNNTLYIVFTGTQLSDIYDMTFNVNIFKTHKFGGRVHTGFHNRAINYFGNDTFKIWFNKIFKNAERQKTNIDQIVFSGHSLGGAASQIVGTYYWHHCNTNYSDKFCSIPSQIITFGSPLTFQKGCNVHPKMTHIINDNDMIPRILRDFEFLYSGTFSILMVLPHLPHVMAVTVFLSILSMRRTTYTWPQVIIAFIVWVLFIYKWFSKHSWQLDVGQIILYILNSIGYNNIILCESFHKLLIFPVHEWMIHAFMFIVIILKRLIFERCMHTKFCKFIVWIIRQIQPFLDFIPFILRILAIVVPCFVAFYFIRPHYYSEGNVIHIQKHHQYGICNKMNASNFYKNMRTGYEESFFMVDHKIINYKDILYSLIKGKIKCGDTLPYSSTGQEIEDFAVLLVFIISFIFFLIHFISKSKSE